MVINFRFIDGVVKVLLKFLFHFPPAVDFGIYPTKTDRCVVV